MNTNTTWTWRLPVVLSIAALAAGLLGSTSVGHAASSGDTVFAKRAGFAKNAGAVNGIKASRTPAPGKLVPLGQDGKFPASVGLAGPKGSKGDTGAQGLKGDTGPQGPAGTNGVSGWGYYIQPVEYLAKGLGTQSVFCPAGQKPLGGGISTSDPLKVQVIESAPVIDPTQTGWNAGVVNNSNASINAYVWVICAYVS